MAGVDKFASIKDVPIFRAGIHNDNEFSDADLERIIADSNECLPFLCKSIIDNEYDGSEPGFAEPVPGFINLNHQDDLPTIIKDAVKSIRIKFGKAIKDGVKWITATFENVPDELAEYLSSKYPLRSVEMLSGIYNPYNGKIYDNIIRSVAFLSDEVEPAVAGQSRDLLISYCKNNATVYLHQYTSSLNDGIKLQENGMSDTTQNQENLKLHAAIETQSNMLKEQDAQMKQLQGQLEEYRKNELKSKHSSFVETLEAVGIIPPVVESVSNAYYEALNMPSAGNYSEGHKSFADVIHDSYLLVFEAAKKKVLFTPDTGSMNNFQMPERQYKSKYEETESKIQEYMKQHGVNRKDAILKVLTQE